MSSHRKNTRSMLLGATALAGALTLAIGPAAAQGARQYEFNLPTQPLSSALQVYGATADQQLIFADADIQGRTAAALKGSYTAEGALRQLLAGTDLRVRRTDFGVLQISRADDPQGGSAAGGGAEVEGLIVTAQKREENIQDVPIAISAFSQEDLTERQVAGGPDLITQIPNMSFTKTNFSSYSIQIRGIGTQAISATTDPAVAVAFNNTPFIRNRFFEQEFYDLERLEVLRGPQGTLYGRNATAGVVNLISAKPKFSYDAKASIDIGNYGNQRLEGMVNIPLVEDKVALRLAGAMTKRDGYATNQLTGQQIDGRDLWSGRATLRFEPTDWISANLIYEHFEENDDRLRSGKQLCKKDVPTHVGALPIPFNSGSVFGYSIYLSQGCEPVSLYSAEAFQTPNGYALPYFGPTSGLGNPVAPIDPYKNATQSRDLRVIESSVEPDYRAKTELFELQIAVDLSDSLRLNSETAYNTDSLFSLQDFNRFTTAPGAFQKGPGTRPGVLDANNVFCDPQLGCSDRLLLVDLSTAESSQFSQEFRLGSDFDGPVNFSLGVNFLRHDTVDKYYVFVNSLSSFAAVGQNEIDPDPYLAGVSDNSYCQGGPGWVGDTAPVPDPNISYGFTVGGWCMYMDPNPIGALNDQGRNYFLSLNPYKLISYAAFGELYYNVTDDLKITAGLRMTVDKKQAPQIPSWLLASSSSGSSRDSHSIASGPYPVAQTVDQEWREPTGRLAIDWSPDLGFTDQTLVYASYAHGYKAGGANPPPPVLATYGDKAGGTIVPNEILPDVFGPEFVDAFELGTKNTLFDGALTLNLTGFYYDYKGYQTSEIRNRSAVNSNFDAEVWGAEVEADWRVTEALRFGFKGGYNGTRMADGSNAIDLMDRTAGDPNWVVIRPFPTVPSNCIIPVYVATAGGSFHVGPGSSPGPLGQSGMCVATYYTPELDPITGLPYVADPTIRLAVNGVSTENLGPAYADYRGFDPRTAPNGGKGISKDLSGNELPNAPNYTATVTADYTAPLAGDWLVTLHGDYHYQSESWGRVFNSDPYDRIEGFSTVNAAAIFANEEAGWKVMAYVKNVFDETAITGTFLNSDDTGLTTNVFLTEPRLYGVRITKDWIGGSAWWGDGSRHAAGEPYAFTLEIGGGTSLFGADTEDYAPAWLTEYDAGFPAIPSIQNDDLDWGDTRSIKLTYAPAGTAWRISGTYRFGRTNGHERGAAYEHVAGGCSHSPNIFLPTLPEVVVCQDDSPDNHWRGAVHDAEEHAIADFVVGRETGFGALGRDGKSTLGLGLRHADLQSTSKVDMSGVPDRFVPPDFYLYDLTKPQIHLTDYATTLTSERDFEGVGPSINWDASVLLLGNDEQGRVDLDWSITGGVLFGKQTMNSTEDRLAEYYLGGQIQTVTPRADGTPGGATKTVLYDTPVHRHRSENVTVPNLSLSLGLSYSIDRVKVSTGYSYDRFFDAIDGGYTDSQTFDRTIQGPYLKLSLGFGG